MRTRFPIFNWSYILTYFDPKAHEAAVHAARLRVELSQSKSEQRDYLKNVELARVLDKRAKRKKETTGEDMVMKERPKKVRKRLTGDRAENHQQRAEADNGQLEGVFGSIF